MRPNISPIKYLRIGVLKGLRELYPDLEAFYRQKEDFQDGIIHYTYLNPNPRYRRDYWIYTISLILAVWTVGTVALVDLSQQVNPLIRWGLVSQTLTKPIHICPESEV